jgi:dipeptidyl aminopeptidase/acylaminoacyl peptidase
MKKLFLLFAVLFFVNTSFAQYQKPPKEIEDILNAPSIPTTSVSPAKDKILMLEPLRYPPISELAQPMLRLAGIRINPNTNGLHRQFYAVKLTLKNIADGKEMPIGLPPNAQIISPQWSANGKYIAAGNLTATGVQLWIIETETAKATQVKNVQVNTVFDGYNWMPDQQSLLVNLVPSKRAVAPQYQNLTPTSPNIQETAGKSGAVQTFQDLLKSPNDENLFEYYATSQTAVVSVDGKVKTIGEPAIFDTTDVSPDGKYILTSRIKRPFSYLFPFNRFPKDTEVWDLNGKSVYKVSSSPLEDNLPVQGVPVGPRSIDWILTEAATLVWAEALDGGNPKTKAALRDKLVKIAAPFSGSPTDLINRHLS